MTYYKARQYRYNKKRVTQRYRSRRGRSRWNTSLLRSQTLKRLVVFGVVFFVVIRLIGGLFASHSFEQVSATLTIGEGSTEYYFPEQSEWQRAASGLEFREGDHIRTRSVSQSSLEIFPGTVLFLNQDTELKIQTMQESSSGIKQVALSLEKGQIWIKTSSEDFGVEPDSYFTVRVPRGEISIKGTIVDIASSEVRDVIRLVRGSVDVDIFNPETDSAQWTKSVDVGQQITLDETTIGKLESDLDIKDIIDSSFVESEWHISNLQRFSPEEAAELRRQVESRVSARTAPSTPPTEEPVEDKNTSFPSPSVTSHQDGGVIPASQTSITLEGTAPENTRQIIVNGYTLNRFNAGDRIWRYIASTEFGTLLSGNNVYEVVAVSRAGVRSQPFSITLQYEGSPVESSSNTGMETSVIRSDIQEYKSPVVTDPVAIPDGGVYETSSPSFTISGLVDPKTNGIMVNDYRLRQFLPGNTNFRYTVNAKASSPNMVPGENTYSITSFGPDGKEANTLIKVIYTPIDL